MDRLRVLDRFPDLISFFDLKDLCFYVFRRAERSTSLVYIYNYIDIFIYPYISQRIQLAKLPFIQCDLFIWECRTALLWS